MNQLLISVLLATAAVLSFGALLLLGLIALAGVERPLGAGWTQRILCRLSFDRLGCCDVAGKAG
ncbi:hypothetical protein [Pusillimonas sp.]|uniref:hypothetical protein n=1 Tax=Pusillimonas sp. TaxID=3040095 RepID=UPI0037C90843